MPKQIPQRDVKIGNENGTEKHSAWCLGGNGSRLTHIKHNTDETGIKAT